MPEIPLKTPQSASPVARAGGGDISERELSRERNNLQITPPARSRPHPRKQLYSAPVNKFTAKRPVATNSNLARIRSCLDEYNRTPARRVKMGPKAMSMEDLTPTKRLRKEKKGDPPMVRSPRLHSIAEQQAAYRIARFMMLAAWRRRRDEVKCLRKTLEFQIIGSERLRVQISTLKSLLDADNCKVVMAMKELKRLKQLIQDKELEKAVLEREKLALESDVTAAEDRASEMSIGWRNCRNELEGVRAAAAVCEHALSLEKAAVAEARAQRDHAYARLTMVEEELCQHEALLSSAEAEVAALRRETDQRKEALDLAYEQIKAEQEVRERCCRDYSDLQQRMTVATMETEALKSVVNGLKTEMGRLADELRATKHQLEWWPRPLTRMLGIARSFLRYPVSVPEAVMWTVIPARHGC